MRIRGHDFMAWYDAWAADGSSSDLVWENDGSVHDLHGPSGEWLLDPSATYVLDELGEIQHERSSRNAIDTEAVVVSWLRRRNLDVHVVEVPSADLADTLLSFRARGFILAVEPRRNEVSGADLVAFLEGGVPDGTCIATDLRQDADGRWDVDVLRTFRLSDLVEIEGPGDLQEVFEAWVRDRDRIPVAYGVPKDVAPGPVNGRVPGSPRA